MEAPDLSAREPRIEKELWWGMAAGPLAWGLDLGFSYSLTQHTCSTGHYYVLHLISVLCFLLALTGLFTAFANHRRFAGGEDKGERPRDRAYFQAWLGILFSASFAVVIIAGSVPRWIMPPCS
jgi:hypothetical protein